MNLFSYESKPMQIIMQLGDLIILNLLYLLCCIPIFTIGAAQAGLYSGVKVMQDPEDDTYVTTAFFKGFRNGFGRVTIAWCLLFAVELVLAIVAYACVYYQQIMNADLPLWTSLIGLWIVGTLQALVTVFHSRFSCTAMQLLRNAFYLAIFHPIRSLAVTVFTWLPLLCLLLSPGMSLFMALTPIWIAIYFSGTFGFNYSFMKKPFQVLIDDFNETKEEAEKEQEDPVQI